MNLTRTPHSTRTSFSSHLARAAAIGLVLASGAPSSAFAATQTFSGANNHGNWAVSGTWLSGTPPTTGDSIVFDGAGTYTYSNNTLTAGTNFDSLTISAGKYYYMDGNLANFSGTMTANYASGSNTINFQLGGAASFTKSGNGTISLTKTNSFTGNLQINGGSLSASASNATGSTSSGSVTVASTAQLRLTGASTTFGRDLTLNGTGNYGGGPDGALRTTAAGITYSGDITLGSTTLIFDSYAGGGTGLTVSGNVNLSTHQAEFAVSASGISSVTGVISGTGDLLKSSGGTLELHGDNTYTGDTTVSGGTLLLASDGQLTFEILTNGVNNQINGSGTATLNGQFVFDLTGANTTAGNSWTIVNVGTLSETFGGTFSVAGFTENSNVWTKVDGANLFTFTEATGVLGVSAVPEPTSLGLLVLGGLGLVGLRRRVRR